MIRHARRLAVPLLPALLLAGAWRTWKPASVSRNAETATPVATRSRLTHLDGRVEQVARAFVERDTVRAERGGVAMVVPLDTVREVRVQRLDWPRTLGLVGGLLAFSFLFGG